MPSSIKSHPFLYSLLFSLLFFLIANLLTSSKLYPYFSGDSFKIEAPVGTQIVSDGEIFSRAFKAYIPWLFFSPRVLSSPCDGWGCLFKPVSDILVYLIYIIVIYVLTRLILNPERTKKALIVLLILWLLFAGFGGVYVYKTFIMPLKRLNSYLLQLKKISGKQPFPPGTVMTEASYDVHGGIIFTVFNLTYQNPDNLKEKYYEVNLVFWQKALQKEACAQYSARVFGAPQVEPGVWRCEQRRYATFLDSQQQILLQTWKAYPESSPTDQLPTLMRYYKK